MMSAGIAKNATRYTSGGPTTSHFAIPTGRRVIASAALLRDEMAGIDVPAHFHGVADLEELRAAALRVGKQRLDAAATRRLHAVDGDIAHVQKVGHRAAIVVVRRIHGCAGSDADFLRSQRDRAWRADRNRCG